MTEAAPNYRTVAGIVDALETPEGDGFIVHRAFPGPRLSQLDPFLLLDEMGPLELPPGASTGFPEHPHRGFETVTYLLEGRMEHRDSNGRGGLLRPGDVQWMTAGSGLVHSEMPEKEFRRQGGLLHGFQLWVNLPRRDKMMAPRYQEIPAERIPVGQSDDGLVEVRVIAGEAFGERAVIETRTPIVYLHFTLRPGGHVAQELPRDFNACAFVIEGAATFGGEERPARKGQLVLFAQDGGMARFANSAEAVTPLDVLLIAGQPLHEPVARLGPFVMNTRQEILEAVDDYHQGRMGVLTR